MNEDVLKNNHNEIHKASSEDALKDTLITTLSHAIRTPLNGILPMVKMLEDAGPLNAKQKEYVKNLSECSYQLSNIVNNILDFSKMTSNRFYLVKQPFSLGDCINDAIEMVKGNAISKGLNFTKEIYIEDVPTLVGDPNRITQILINLLNNAIKFTDKGTVVLRVNTTLLQNNETSYDNNKRKIHIEVEDTGEGIPLEDQDKIFEIFHQSSLNNNYYTSKTGTGLGLSIVKELVKLMNGDIQVSSEGIKGKGSKFSINIILEEEIDVNSLNKDNIKLFNDAKVLVVDDRAELRLQICELLMKWKCIPFIVSRAEEGLNYIKNGMEFSTIIVDICMPYMSGVEMAQELRNILPETPLIGLSSVEIKTGEKYFDVYMYKPVNQNQLFPALLKCLEMYNSKEKKNKNTRNTKDNTLEKKSRKDLRILIAEDEKHNSYCIREMLCNLGYKKFKDVKDGKECLEKIKKSKTKYDVILMDIIMPNMDGVEATRHIRAMKNPPYIIAVSAAVMNSDKERCQSAGIDAYLSKPLTKEKLDNALLPLIYD